MLSQVLHALALSEPKHTIELVGPRLPLRKPRPHVVLPGPLGPFVGPGENVRDVPSLITRAARPAKCATRLCQTDIEQFTFIHRHRVGRRERPGAASANVPTLRNSMRRGLTPGGLACYNDSVQRQRSAWGNRHKARVLTGTAETFPAAAQPTCMQGWSAG